MTDAEQKDIGDELLAEWIAKKKADNLPYGIDPENITGEEIKTLMLTGFKTNSADIGADDTAIEMLLGFMGGRELTGDGLHPKVSGERGSGKSVSMNASLVCLPPGIIYAGAFTPKALIYDKSLKPGSIIKVDESQELTDEFLAVMKESISSFQEPIKYRTVIDKKVGTTTIVIPERLTWIVIGVDNVGDEQVLDRLFPIGIDPTGKHANITSFRLTRRSVGQEKIAVNDDVMKIRYALTHYLDKKFRVIIPYAENIQYKPAVEKDQRLQEFFETAIIYHSALCYRERKHELKDDVITVYADERDFKEVSKLGIFNRPFESTNRLLPSEIQLINDIIKNGLNLGGDVPVSRSRLLELGYSQSRLSHILNGRNKDGNGLLSKVPGMAETTLNITVSEEDRYGSKLIEKYRKNENAFLIPKNITRLVAEGIASSSQAIATCNFEMS